MEVFKKRILTNGIFQVLRVRPFFLLMLSEFFSQLAFNMQHFVLIFIIYGFTHSNTAVSGMLLSFMVPAVLFSVISGVYVDRWNKKKIILFAHLIRAILLLPFLIPNLHLGLIYTFTFLIAVVSQFLYPAESSIVPQLAPKKLIVPANAVFSFAMFGIMLAGYILSGPVLLLLGKTYTIVFLIALFLISAFVVVKIKLSSKREKIQEKSYSAFHMHSIVREVREVFVFIKRVKRVMHALLMITIAQAVLFIFAVLAPGYVTTILAAPLETLSVILIAPAGIGLAIGAFLLGSIGKKLKHELVSIVGFAIVGIVFILMPFTGRLVSYESVNSLNSFLPHIININVLHVIVIMAFIIGFGIALVFIPSNSTIQLETDEEMRGRMYGLLSSLVGAVSFLPVILAGGLADLFGVGAVIVTVGILMLIFSVSSLFLIKS